MRFEWRAANCAKGGRADWTAYKENTTHCVEQAKNKRKKSEGEGAVGEFHEGLNEAMGCLMTSENSQRGRE